jgi:glutamyl-tRNA synthetase
MKEIILRHTLLNAFMHKGKADVQAVLGKTIAEIPETRGKVKETVLEIKKIVEEVNSWSTEKQNAQMKKLGIEIEKEKPSKKELTPLPNAEIGKVVMRLAPFPSGPLHIGNARMVVLNDEYVKKYKGKLLCVIDDTIGSEEKFILPDAYDLIIDGLEWLGINYNELLYKSDRLQLFYDFVKEMIENGIVYVCECSAEKLRENRYNGVECKHRKRTAEENMKIWEDMLTGKYREGGAVARLKTDMKHPNPAFRDRVLLRIVERAHPKVGTKYIVWPMLEFSWAIDDHVLGITHILRGKDLVMEDMMEEFIWNKLGWKKAEFVHYGLLNIEETKLSKTEARKAIERGKYTGWDDPRTWSLQALRRRGIQPEAVRKFVLDMGMSMSDVSVPAEILYAENRKIIDSKANRYFAVFDPVKISVKDAPKIKGVDAPMHPDFPKRGNRRITVDTQRIYIEKGDLEKYNNKELGLMNLFSIKLMRNPVFLGKKIDVKTQKIHWVSEPNVKIRVVMPDGSTKEGLAEQSIRNVKVDDIVQLQRSGFFRCDQIGKEPVFYFAHK